jgi:hypothetical protein
MPELLVSRESDSGRLLLLRDAPTVPTTSTPLPRSRQSALRAFWYSFLSQQQRPCPMQ